jgi:hypothetical protein
MRAFGLCALQGISFSKRELVVLPWSQCLAMVIMADVGVADRSKALALKA